MRAVVRQRLDDRAGLEVSASGWDSQMVAYAYVFPAGKQWWMLYNGNDYGKDLLRQHYAEHDHSHPTTAHRHRTA